MPRAEQVDRIKFYSIITIVLLLAVLQLPNNALSDRLSCASNELCSSTVPEKDAQGKSGCKIVTKEQKSACKSVFAKANTDSAVFAMLGKSGTLSEALTRLGLSKEEKHQIFELIEGKIDDRRLSDKTGIAAVRNFSGNLKGVLLRDKKDFFWKIALPFSSSDSGSVELASLPVSSQTEHAYGIVSLSLRQALSVLPHGEALVKEIAEIFSWQIDFRTDPRKGDRVDVVYKVNFLAEIPNDLPPFGTDRDETGMLLGVGPVLAVRYQGEKVNATAFRVEDSNGIANYYNEAGIALSKSFLKSPVRNSIISSDFSLSRINPVTGRKQPHLGIDFAAPAGSPIMAGADGLIESVGWRGLMGKSIVISHGNGYETVYGHLEDYAQDINVGKKVFQGQKIGFVGSTGRATGPHVHYAMIYQGRLVNPLGFKNPPGEPISAEMKPLLELAKQLLNPTLAALDFSSKNLAFETSPTLTR